MPPSVTRQVVNKCSYGQPTIVMRDNVVKRFVLNLRKIFGDSYGAGTKNCVAANFAHKTAEVRHIRAFLPTYWWRYSPVTQISSSV
jgi:hypothetical protein